MNNTPTIHYSKVMPEGSDVVSYEGDSIIHVQQVLRKAISSAALAETICHNNGQKVHTVFISNDANYVQVFIFEGQKQAQSLISILKGSPMYFQCAIWQGTPLKEMATAASQL